MLLLLLGVLAFIFVHTIYPFLAPNAPLPAKVLVVEGWGSDGMLQAAIAEYHRNHYDKVYVTGVPIERGAPFFEQHTYAELAAALLVKFGLDSNVVQAVPAPHVVRDRTYSSALALKHWFQDHQLAPASINLFTVGPHARRSRMLFQRALGKDIQVGVFALEEDDFDPKHWWRTSEGVRTVIGETLAYGYARFLFHPPKENP